MISHCWRSRPPVEEHLLKWQASEGGLVPRGDVWAMTLEEGDGDGAWSILLLAGELDPLYTTSSSTSPTLFYQLQHQPDPLYTTSSSTSPTLFT